MINPVEKQWVLFATCSINNQSLFHTASSWCYFRAQDFQERAGSFSVNSGNWHIWLQSLDRKKRATRTRAKSKPGHLWTQQMWTCPWFTSGAFVHLHSRTGEVLTVTNMQDLVLIPMTLIPPLQNVFVYDSITKIFLGAFFLAIPKHSFPLMKTLVFLWGVVCNLDTNFGWG